MLSANFRHASRRCVVARGLATTSRRGAASSTSRVASVLMASAVGAAVVATAAFPQRTTALDAAPVLQPKQPTKETATGIIFPPNCNGLTFAGCGVRIKYGFIKVSLMYIRFPSTCPRLSIDC